MCGMAVRVLSLFPAATDIMYGIGAGGMLCGITDGCRQPPGAAPLPRVIRPPFDSGRLSSAEIESAVSAGGGQFVLDEDAVRAAAPDLVIGQQTCRVCAAHEGHLGRVSELCGGARTHLMGPRTIPGILESITELGRLTGMDGGAAAMACRMREGIERVRRGARKRRPRVLAIEWLDPLYVAGHWVPEMVSIAGGENLGAEPGADSRRLGPGEVRRLSPDIIVAVPCGFGIARTVSEYGRTLARDAGWNALGAVQAGAVYAANAGHFSGPGPGIIEGIAALAGIISGSGGDGTSAQRMPAYWH